RGGTIAPESAKPKGTPVCFTVKEALYHVVGTRWAMIAALGAVSGPLAPPTRNTPKTSATGVATVITVSPRTPDSSAVWQSRTAPKRASGPALKNEEVAATP